MELHCGAKICEPWSFSIAARNALGRAQCTVQPVNDSIFESNRVCVYAQGCLYSGVDNIYPAVELGRAGQPHRSSHCQSLQIRRRPGNFEISRSAAKVFEFARKFE